MLINYRERVQETYQSPNLRDKPESFHLKMTVIKAPRLGSYYYYTHRRLGTNTDEVPGPCAATTLNTSPGLILIIALRGRYSGLEE